MMGSWRPMWITEGRCWLSHNTSMWWRERQTDNVQNPDGFIIAQTFAMLMHDKNPSFNSHNQKKYSNQTLLCLLCADGCFWSSAQGNRRSCNSVNLFDRSMLSNKLSCRSAAISGASINPWFHTSVTQSVRNSQKTQHILNYFITCTHTHTYYQLFNW